MTRSGRLAVVASMGALAGAGGASAQVISRTTVTLSATNAGTFAFTIKTPSFSFGNVDMSGTVSAGTGVGVVGGGRTASNNGGFYTADAAATWNCLSAPQRTIKIYNTSTTVVGALPGNRLEMRIPAVGGGTSQGYRRFSSDTGSPAGDLITGMHVKNGSNDVDGQLDYRLTVLDADPLGSTTWTVVLTASGL